MTPDELERYGGTDSLTYEQLFVLDAERAHAMDLKEKGKGKGKGKGSCIAYHLALYFIFIHTCKSLEFFVDCYM